MTRYVSLASLVLVTLIPFWIKPAWLVGVLASAAALFCLAGLLRRSLGLVLAGCVLAVIDLALALWWSAASLSAFGAVLFGLALLLLIDGTHFAAQFVRADVAPAAWRAQLAWWIARAALCVIAAVLLALIASALTLVMPTSAQPILAAAGALTAAVAALAAVLSGNEGAS